MNRPGGGPKVLIECFGHQLTQPAPHYVIQEKGHRASVAKMIDLMKLLRVSGKIHLEEIKDFL